MSGREKLVVAALGLMLAWPAPHFPELRSPNELVRIYLVRALVDDGSVQLDRQFARHGRLTDHARRAGHVYSDKAPGLSLLGVPLYAAMRLVASAEAVSTRLLGWVLRFCLIVLPTITFVALLLRWLAALGVERSTRVLTAGAYVLGTTAFAYSVKLVGHQAAAWMLGGALIAAERGRGGNSRWRLAAGLGAGLAAVTEYPLAALGPVIAALTSYRAARPWRGLVDVALGAAAPLLAAMVYHHLAFGGPFTTGYSFVAERHFAAIHARGFFGLGWPSATTLLEATIGWQRGAFVVMPLLLLAPLGALARRGQGPLVGALGLTAAWGLFVAAGFGYPLGGWSVGPRHLIATLPAWLMLVALGLDALGRAEARARRGLWLASRALVVWSACACTAAALTYPGYPEEIRAPLVQVTWQLVGRLRGPQSLGTAIGLSSEAALACSLVAAVLVLVWCVAGAPLGREEWRAGLLRAAPAVWLGVGGLVLLSASAPAPTARERFRLAWLVTEVFRPQDAPPRADPRLADWEAAHAALARGQLLPRYLAAEGAMAAALGDDAAALRWYTLAAHRASAAPASSAGQGTRHDVSRSSTTAAPSQATTP